MSSDEELTGLLVVAAEVLLYTNAQFAVDRVRPLGIAPGNP
ncbi:MAG TPA: hypothetical protein VIS99_11410 [Terrimicrobiaceae bacterium]